MKDMTKSFPQTGSEACMILASCMESCWACAKKCMDEGHAMTAMACMDAAEACSMALKAHCCSSPMKSMMMEMCQKACSMCADECKKTQTSYCQDCAEMCMECADCCKS